MSLLCSQQLVVPRPHWHSRRFRTMTQSSTGTHAHVPGLADIPVVVGSPEVVDIPVVEDGLVVVDSPVVVDIPVVEDSPVVEVGIHPVLGQSMVEEVLRNTNAQSMAPAQQLTLYSI